MAKCIDIIPLALLSAALATIQSVLVFAGVLPNVLSFTAGNAILGIARLGISGYAGRLSKSLKEAGVNGAIVAFAGTATLLAFGLAGSFLLKSQALGIQLPGGIYLAVFLAILLAVNAAIGAVIGVATKAACGFFAGKPGKPKKK